jgi:signal transduction histidine kinase
MHPRDLRRGSPRPGSLPAHAARSYAGRVQEPTSEQYNPPLTWQGHLWRTLLALAISALIWGSMVALQIREAPLLFWVDLGLGVTAFALSFLRRRYPLPVALAISAMGALSASSAGPGALASVSLAVHRRVWQIVLTGVVAMVGAQVFWAVEPQPDSGPWWVNFAVGLAVTIALLVSGMYIGSRRELLWTLRDRAERAEAEQGLRVEQGRTTERSRIAREMHDVLAHRISLISMHAGALSYRTDLTAEEMRETAELIQLKSHEALTDLRQVLGVLRDGDTAAIRERPQPTFEDIGALVAEASASGMQVRYDERVDGAPSMPERVGRTTYRIVQEGLTNARKHAPGVAVLVDVDGSADDGIRIRIRNPARSATARNGLPTPGAGLGLVGLGERAKLAGGRLEVRRNSGTFELEGWLPWKV